MRLSGVRIVLDEVDSTQRVAKQILLEGREVGCVFAHHQTAGVGRFGRKWESARGASFTASFVFEAPKDAPWLIGMAVAVAVAETIDCEVRWPNDLGLDGKKLGGILSELAPAWDGEARLVVGLGLNLGSGPTIAFEGHATSLLDVRGEAPAALDLLEQLSAALIAFPTPSSWRDLAARWAARDATLGKRYKLPDGSEAIAVGVSETGSLLATVDGEPIEVLAADAIFGA